MDGSGVPHRWTGVITSQQRESYGEGKVNGEPVEGILRGSMVKFGRQAVHRQEMELQSWTELGRAQVVPGLMHHATGQQGPQE